MMRLIAYLLFGLGIAAAIVGGAKLPDSQVTYLQKLQPLQKKRADAEEALAKFENSIAERGQDDAKPDDNDKESSDETAAQQLTPAEEAEKERLEEAVDEAKLAVKNLKGWPPQNNSEKFSNAIPVFCVGVGVALVGIVLWRIDIRDRRIAERAEAESEHDDESSDRQHVTSYVKSVQPAIRSLAEEKRRSHTEFLHDIDAVLEAHIHPFVSQRHHLIEDMGLGKAAPVLLHMARGERLLNRAWSAEADGFTDEAMDAIQEACGVFEEALETLEGKEE